MILRLLRVVELKLRGSPSTFLEQPRAGLTMFIITVETNHAPKRIMISQFGDQPNLLLNVKTRLLLLTRNSKWKLLAPPPVLSRPEELV